jgi:hypothetical protein
MSRTSAMPPCPFSTAERALIRQEFGMHFGQLPALADGIFLRSWRAGPQAGQPKVPLALQGLLARGLLEIRTNGRFPRAFFTAAGHDALRQLASDPRRLDPARYGHLRRELGLDADQPSIPPLAGAF